MIKALFAISCVGLLAPTVFPQGSVWRKGRPLPELRLPTIDGDRTIDLAELRGKKLLLIEFASW